jgi:hypothetical protein
MKLIFLFSLLFCLQSCVQNKNIKLDTYDQYRTQRIEERDSLFILYTIKEWHNNNWWTFRDYSTLYQTTNDQVEHFIGGTFYSPDRKKIMVWIGEKMYNAKTIENNRPKLELNRICPTAGDTVYSMSAVIGIRKNVNDSWQLYPFDNRAAGCYGSKKGVISELGRYYFEKMKIHKMFKMIQSGENKGRLELTAYGYNLQDKDFWDKCWLFEKDTVGSYGLYPFQIKGYDRRPYYDKGGRCTQKCADPYNSPAIEYPEEILKLYK